MRLSEVALACAIGEAGRGVRELGGNNRGSDVRGYLQNAGVHVPAAWCAAFVQCMADRAASLLGLSESPLDAVDREALVADYVDLASGFDWLVSQKLALPGDLVAFKFGSADPLRWNHIGFLLESEASFGGAFSTVEGNTSGIGDTEGVYIKHRSHNSARVCFMRWDE